MPWDPTRIKPQLRYAAQGLGQLQNRLDSQNLITKRDIATLLQQGNVVLARAKAQNAIKEEIKAGLLHILEFYIVVIIERFDELEVRTENPSLKLVEATSSIIYAASQTDIEELHSTRDILVEHLGLDFALAVTKNPDQYASPRVIGALSVPSPSATGLDDYLASIATAHGVQWIPDFHPHEKLTAISEILDPASSPVVDVPQLRRLCSHGLSNQPAWLRPRIWRILLGLLPAVKSAWINDARKQRESYYDLVRRLLEPFSNSNCPPPSTPLSSSDATLLRVVKLLTGVPPNLYSYLQEEPEALKFSPLDATASDDIRISCAGYLDSRLEEINDPSSKASDPQFIPEIRLESDETMPEISIIPPGSSSRRPNPPTTLLASSLYTRSGANRKHMSALIRLLYIHTCLNPANQSPHMASLLIPLYSVLNTEIETDDLAHVEADTFWLFEAMVGEFSELEDEEGGNIWIKKLGERLASADPELSADLQIKGLDPGLPHYSYRWLGPLLTHTLPLSSVWVAWDVLLSRPMRERNLNQKLESLLDICTSLLIRARSPLFRLGKPGRRSPGLWTEENSLHPPPSPLRAWEFSDAFMEGMTLLQFYPIEAAGGIDRILQTAADLALKRETESKPLQAETFSFGSRIRETVWKGFTNQVTSPPLSPILAPVEESDGMEGEEEESSSENYAAEPRRQPRSSSGFTSLLTNAVWRGITNQSAMEDSATPVSESPQFQFPPSPTLRGQSMSPIPPSPLSLVPLSPAPEPAAVTANIWSYAEKLRDSDTAAQLAKATTNLRVKALSAWGNRGKPESKSAPISPPSSPFYFASRVTHLSRESVSSDTSSQSLRSSMHDFYGGSSPERPAYFRNPRDSVYVNSRNLSISSSPDMSPQSDTGSAVSESGRSMRGGPKPLLLARGTMMTSSTPTLDKNPFFDVSSRSNRDHDSVYSALSASPTGHRSRISHRSDSRDWESDTTRSRIVPLRRASVSPIVAKEIWHSLPGSASSVASFDKMLPNRVPEATEASVNKYGDGIKGRGNGRIPSPDSPTTLASSPPPKTPKTSLIDQTVRVQGSERRHEFVGFSESSDATDDSTAISQRFIPKQISSPTSIDREVDNASNFPTSPRMRSKLKRQLPRLRMTENSLTPDPSPNSLVVPTSQEMDGVATPKATGFEVPFPSPVSPGILPKRPRKASSAGRDTPVRKLSGEDREVRPRKVSADGNGEAISRKTYSEGRLRKMSTSPRGSRRSRDSTAIEGDDEGYDDLLSAYESEEEH